MIRSWETTPLGGWGRHQPAPSSAQVVDLAAFRATSVRWRIEIEPRSVGALERFDRMVGLLPPTPVHWLPQLRRA
ncbi:hypothetical protein [Bosea sp. LjRoot237]|uniref:hypothetical protein n=1 Tax=Bosea sp. LjRoot237 TaxID=3342292 RepID=UPI003ED0463F